MTKQFVTPAGIAVYPRLKAGSPDTKFHKEGIYKVDLDVPAAEAEDLMDKLEEIRDNFAEELKAQLPAAKAKKLKVADLPIEENEDGTVRFKFKMKAKVETKKASFTQHPAVFDAKGQPMFNIKKHEDGSETHEPVDIWGGSKLRVAFDAVPYESPLMGVGLTLRLKAVKVLELVEGGANKSASGFGFGEEEEGYAHEAKEVQDAHDFDDEDLDEEGADEREDGDF